MAAGKSSLTRWEPCRLVANPAGADGAALSGSWPNYGGTLLGGSREILWQPGVERRRLIGEDYGGRTIRSSYSQRSAILAANARGWDADLLALLPGGASANGGTLRSTTSSSSQPGVFLPRIKLLLVPEDATNGIGLILYAASVLTDATARVRRSYSHEFGRGLVWEAELDDTGRDWLEGPLSQLVV